MPSAWSGQRVASTLARFSYTGLGMARPLAPTLLTALVLSSSACWFGGYEGEYIEADDVRLDVPGIESFRDGELRGDAYGLINETAANTNGWVTSVVETTGYVIEILNNYRETSQDGSWRIYGPFDDDSGRDIAWLVRIDGALEATNFEILVAPKGTTDADAFELLNSGNINVDGDLRTGSMLIDFDVVDAYEALNTTLLWSVAGDITIDFSRDVGTGDKTISLDYAGFVAQRTGLLDDDLFTSDETYEYVENGDGSGSFHLALMGEWDTYPHGWSGPERERMQLDMVWDGSQAGRARGLIEEVDGVGDMLHGNLRLDECFDGAGTLSWRWLTELYAQETGIEYNFGDEATCVFTDAEL